MLLAIKFRKSILVLLTITTTSLAIVSRLVTCQLPDDIQRELNQNLAEQARIQAQRQAHQNQLQSRSSQPAGGQRNQPAHDPNNYSYQQVSPPIQYSYYQPFGDAATSPQQQPQPQSQSLQQQSQPQQNTNSQQPVNFDFNNLNFDLPQPQAQVAAPRQSTQANNQQQHLTPSFTGVGGLPVLQPIASQAGSYVPAGNPPLQPQARVQQQGPPLTEADFKDITGGENYGAPGGNDFGLGDAANIGSSQGGGGANQRRSDNTDAQLREFGMPAEGLASGTGTGNRAGSSGAGGSQIPGIPDFGAFNPIGAGGGGSSGGQRQRSDPSQEFGDFGAPGGLGAGGGGNGGGGGGGSPQSADFDFASQPSSARGDQAASAGGAPGSLQSLLGSSFPGLGGSTQSGLDDFARTNPQPSGGGGGQQRTDDGALDIADMGDKSDGFSGADLGGFEQPSPQGDQDFNYGAASNQQPKSVPYPDANPQAVGTLLALTQPQSMTQTRYSALPDKGSYQDYPAYKSGGNDFSLASRTVDSTASARPPGPGRYGAPLASQLAPEHRPSDGQEYNYAYGPTQRAGAGASNEAESTNELFDESPFDE